MAQRWEKACCLFNVNSTVCFVTFEGGVPLSKGRLHRSFFSHFYKFLREWMLNLISFLINGFLWKPPSQFSVINHLWDKDFTAKPLWTKHQESDCLVIQTIIIIIVISLWQILFRLSRFMNWIFFWSTKVNISVHNLQKVCLMNVCDNEEKTWLV